MASLGSRPQAARTSAARSFNDASILARMTLSFMELQCSYMSREINVRLSLVETAWRRQLNLREHCRPTLRRRTIVTPGARAETESGEIDDGNADRAAAR